MTALPTPAPTTAPESIDARKWIGLDEAAERLEFDHSHLRRLCREQLSKFGQARKIEPPHGSGGPPRWYIQRSYDLKLAPGIVGEKQRPPTLDRFSEQQRKTAHDRASVVSAYREARSTQPGAVKSWLPRFIRQQRQRFPRLKFTVATVRRWDRLYRTPADLVKLVDTRGGASGGKADPRCWEYFASVFLDENCPPAKQCWRQTREYARAEGLAWCSYQACSRQLDTRIPPQTQAQFRKPKVYRNCFEPYIEQDPDRFAPGICWVGDHRQLDVHVYFGGKLIRPWITAWQDWKSRKIVGWCLSEQPNSSTILAALRSGLLDESNFGGPNQVHVDNGKDYDSAVFDGRTKRERQMRITEQVRLRESEAGGIMGMLKIAMSFSLPYNPRGKGRLERWFGTLAEQFDKRWITYAGATPGQRPERLRQVLKHPHKVPTFEQVEAELAHYIEAYNADADHQMDDLVVEGQRISPNAVMALCPRKRKLEDPDLLNLLLAKWSEPVRVGRNGVAVRIKGKSLSYGQFEPKLARFKGTKRKVRISYDPHDIRTIRVFDDQWRFVCVAGANQFGGAGNRVGEADVGELIAEQRRYRRAKHSALADWKHDVFRFGDLLRDKASAPPPRPSDDVPLQVVKTPIDGSLKDVQAERVRKAAGAEGGDSTDRPAPNVNILDFLEPEPSGKYNYRFASAEQMSEGAAALESSDYVLEPISLAEFCADLDGPDDGDEWDDLLAEGGAS